MKQVVDAVEADVATKGYDILSGKPKGDYAVFHRLELGAAINRLRTLSIIPK